MSKQTYSFSEVWFFTFVGAGWLIILGALAEMLLGSTFGNPLGLGVVTEYETSVAVWFADLIGSANGQ